MHGRESAIFTGALVVGAFFFSFGILHYGVFTKNVLLDTPLYERYGDAIVHHGQVPYRDFAVEYPPGALAVFIAPSLIAGSGDFLLYEKLFEGLMLACWAVAAGLVAFVLARQKAGTMRLTAGTLLAGLAPLALGPVVLSRFDLWPAMLTIAALTALVSNRPRLGFGLLGAAVVAKVYPVILVPLATAYVWRAQGRRAALECLGVLVGVLLVCVAPFLVLAPHGVWASVSGQLGRPLQIESLGAAILLGAHQLTGLSLTEFTSHGSDNLGGNAASTFETVQSVLSIATIVGLWVAFARGPATRDRMLRYSAALVCAFIVWNKVLSPQYLIWLIALVPLVRGRRGAVAGAFFVFAMVLTQLWFPSHYIALVYSLDARSSWYVLARDVALLGLLATLVWPPDRRPRAGIAAVAALGAASILVAAVGAATTGSTSFAVHSGLLDESGIASSCAAARPAPLLSQGVVSYVVARLPSPPSDSSCVSIHLRAKPRVELFSAAYRGAFQPGDVRAGYLGDAGKCTNVPGLSTTQISYSVGVTPGAVFTVEVENCGSASAVPPFTLDVDGGGKTAPAEIRAAAASQSGNRLTVTWTTAKVASGTTFTLYRQLAPGRLVPVETIRGPGGGGSFHRIVDRHAPLERSVRYWILSQAPGRAWNWHGPLATT